MSGDRFSGGLHAWIDPEIEVRVVAWILGEASEFEADALEQMLKERPELRVFKRRLEVVHYLMSEAVKSGDCEKWRLSPERRAGVLEALGIASDENLELLPAHGGWEHRVRRAGVRVALMAAACLVISLVLAPFLLRREGEMHVESPSNVSYMAIDEDMTLDGGGESAPNLFGERVPEARFVASGVEAIGGTRSSSGEGGGGAVRAKLAALKANLGRGGLLIEDGNSPVVDAVPGFSVVDQSGPAMPALSMPEVNESARPLEGAVATPDEKSGVATHWDHGESDSPEGAEARPGNWKRGSVHIAGQTMSKDRVVRREVPPVVESFDGFLDYTKPTRERSTDGDVNGRTMESEEELAFEMPALEGIAGDAEPDYDLGMAVDRRDGSDLRDNSDNSVGYRWSERLGTVTGFRSQTDPMTGNGDGGISLPDPDELLALQNQLVTERVARTDARPAAVSEEPPVPEDSEVDLRTMDEDLDKSVTSLTESLQTQLNLVESRVEQMGQVVHERRDMAVDKALGSHDYIKSKREYEQAQSMLQSMKLQQSTKRVSLKTPKNPITVHETAKASKKSYQKRRTDMEKERAERALESIDAELREQEDLVEEKRKVLDTVVQAIGIPYAEGVRGSGAMGRSQEGVYELSERNLYELEKEKQQLELQVKTLLKLKGKDRLKYAAGLQLPQNGVTALYEQHQEAVRDLDRLKAAGLGEEHPDVRVRMRHVGDLQKDLREALPGREVEASPNVGGTKKPDLARKSAEIRRLAVQKKREAMLKMEKNAAQEAFSTFSLHVSEVSFKLAQAALAKGEWPDAARIRVEEFVNAFDYGDPSPSQDEKVACALEQATHPFMQQRNMLRIAMRTAAMGRASGIPLRLTVLLDNSGSMERSDREESVRRAFELLAAQMNPQDEMTLISFARTPRLMRDSVPGDQVGDLVQLIADTPSEGGTNLEEALRLGLEKAQEDFLEGAQNRIILLTDGAANLGNAEPELLGGMVEKMRQKGIAFDACGVGADGLNDDVLEALTRKGDGRYYFLDRPEDADAGFAKQIAGALRPAANNVKVQVEFNPKRVGKYRLYGFEKHELKKEDFRNDRVDAAEMAAEEAGVAMYQVETRPDGEGDVGSVSVRFQDMASGEMVEKRWTIPYEANPASLAGAAPSMTLAASAAFLGEKLKGSPVGELVDLAELNRVSRSLQTVYPASERVGQLIDMIEKARRMAR